MGQFQIGHKLSKGRPKGSRNKRNLLKVEDILLANNVNPIQELINIAQSTDKLDIKLSCWKELAKYAYSPKKPVSSVNTIDIQPKGFYITRA